MKLTGSADIHAQGFSEADLRHGPIASIGSDSALLVIDSGGPGSSDLADLMRGPPPAVPWHRGAARWPGWTRRFPRGAPSVVNTILATIRGQQLALALALARGMNPDAPTGLTKITATR